MKFGFVLLSSLLLCGVIEIHAKEIDLALPDMGDSSEAIISPRQEQELGAAFFRSVHQHLTINSDNEIRQYIQNLGKQLTKYSDNPANPFHFFMVMDASINAFAGPGGYIGINSGLVLMTEAESELASVMAHEIAHVTQRHLYRAFEAASKLSIPTAAATLAAILIGTQNPAIGQAAIMAIQAGSIQYQINFTRDNEQEADRVGLKNLFKAHYNPRSMPTFFERLQQSSRFYGKNIPDFLRTHPVTTSRISDTRGRANQYAYQHYPSSVDYLLTQAKLRVLTANNSQKTLAYFRLRQQQGTPQQRDIASYGLGWALLDIQQFSQAQNIFQTLKAKYPNQFQYLNALAYATLEQKKYPAALKLYQQELRKFPNNTAINLDYIQALLKVKQTKLAQQKLQQLDIKIKQQPLYFELLAQAYADLNQMAESQRYLAEYYYLIGLTKTAILHIKLAQKSKPMNFYLRAILAERLRFFTAEELERREND